VSNTAYQYDDKLDCGATYFWAAKVIKPVPSKTYSVATFKVMTKEEAALEKQLAAGIPLWTKIVMAIAITVTLTLMVITVNFRAKRYLERQDQEAE